MDYRQRDDFAAKKAKNRAQRYGNSLVKLWMA
jgi:hypothetical protein